MYLNFKALCYVDEMSVTAQEFGLGSHCDTIGRYYLEYYIMPNYYADYITWLTDWDCSREMVIEVTGSRAVQIAS